MLQLTEKYDKIQLLVTIKKLEHFLFMTGEEIQISKIQAVSKQKILL